MTENKKKRGRPRKIESFQELKEIMQPAPLHENNPPKEINPAEIQKKIAEVKKSLEGTPKLKGLHLAKDQAYDEWSNEFKEKGFATTPNKGILTVDADKFKPLPDDWFSLGKVAKLQWLTANRR